MARLSPKQRLSIREATASVNIWNGSIRSGKTIASLLAFLAWLPEAPPGPVAIIGKTRDTILRNILEVIRQLHPDAISPWTKAATVVTIMGREVHLIGVNDARSEEKVRGLTLAGAYVDEVTLLQRAFFVQLLGRLSVTGSRLFGTTNPDSPQHWLKVDYLNRADQLGWHAWHFVMADNPGLTDEYKAAKAAEFTGLFYQRFILGLWVAAEGAIYDSWDPDRHVIRWADLPPMRSLYAVGVDHGTTNASVGILLGLSEDRKLYLVDEWRHDPGRLNSGTQGQRLTVAEQAASFLEWYRGQHLPRETDLRPRFTVVDPAAAAFRHQLFHDGLRNVRPANNDVMKGIGLVASLLTSGDLLVTDRCQGFISEIPGYSWDAKAASEGVDKPVKVADHSLDAARYAIATTETLWRPALRRAGNRLE